MKQLPQLPRLPQVDSHRRAAPAAPIRSRTEQGSYYPDDPRQRRAAGAGAPSAARATGTARRSGNHETQPPGQLELAVRGATRTRRLAPLDPPADWHAFAPRAAVGHELQVELPFGSLRLTPRDDEETRRAGRSTLPQRPERGRS